MVARNFALPQNSHWKDVVQFLPVRDPESEWFILADIAPLVGIQTRSLAKHARDLWPRHEGHYRLSHEEAVRLIRRVCWAGKKLPQMPAEAGGAHER